MIIQKILSYDIYEGTTGTDRYNRICNILMQTLDPDTLFPDTLDCRDQTVFTSPRPRAVNCLKISSTKSVAEISELNEITFKLNNFCSEQSFLKHGSSAVRSAFIEAFMANKLGTSHSQLQRELDFVLELSRQSNAPICISHTFRMKLIQIYSQIGNELFNNPSVIEKYINPEKHIYTFGETLEI